MALGGRLTRTVVVVAALVVGFAASSVRERVQMTRSQMPDESDVLYVPEPAYLRAMSLGYREALADLLWVRALVFSGASLGEADVRAIERYADAVSGLAPRFVRIYQWGGVTPVYSGGAVTREAVDVSIAVYRSGLEEFPENHQLLYGLGMLLAHQVPSTPGYTEEEQAAAKQEGTRLIRRAAAFGADPLVRQYAATLVSENAEAALARQFLEAELAQAESPDYQRMLRKKLQEIGAGASIESVERVREAFITEHRARAPYLPDTVFVLVRDEGASPPSVALTPSG